jgi:hypothetical protein
MIREQALVYFRTHIVYDMRIVLYMLLFFLVNKKIIFKAIVIKK